MDTIGERIAWARSKRGLTQAELAKRVGISQSAIASYEAGHREKPRELIKIATALGLYPTWLDTGKGDWDAAEPDTFEIPMFSRSTRVQAPEEPAPYNAARRGPTMQPILAWEHEDDLPEGEFVLIPRLDIHLSAGGGRDQVEIELAEKSPIAFRADWIRKKRLKPKKIAAMTASGESMEDRIHDGDLLAVDTSQIEVVDGKVYALWYEGGERVKRLYRMPGGALRIHSDNQDKNKYPDIVLPPAELEHVRIIGRVVHIAGEGGL